MRNKTVKWLILGNCILLLMSWIMSLVAYPRLPDKIPVHFSFAGTPDSWKEKSLLEFFSLPGVQIIFAVGFFLLAHFTPRLNFPKKEFLSLLSQEKKQAVYSLIQEFIFLALIFFNLIFIHLQRSVITTAHQLSQGIDTSYFYSIVGIILLIILLYFLRIRTKMREFLSS